MGASEKKEEQLRPADRVNEAFKMIDEGATRLCVIAGSGHPVHVSFVHYRSRCKRCRCYMTFILATELHMIDVTIHAYCKQCRMRTAATFGESFFGNKDMKDLPEDEREVVLNRYVPSSQVV